MLRMLTRFNSFMLGILVVAAAANAQTTQNGLTAKAGTAPVNNVVETDRSRDGLVGPVRRVRTEVAKLVMTDGSNTLVYDGESQLVSSTGGSGFGGNTTVTIFSGRLDIAEYFNGAAPSAPGNEFIYSGSQRILLMQSGTNYYLHNDHLSLRVRTNASGVVADQRGHYPFGETWYSPLGAPLIFASYYRDTESGNGYAMARTYVNRLGRFSSPDPLSGSIGDPQSLNRYLYVLSDPTNFLDPDGLKCVTLDNGTQGDDGEPPPCNSAAGGFNPDGSQQPDQVIVNGLPEVDFGDMLGGPPVLYMTLAQWDDGYGTGKSHGNISSTDKAANTCVQPTKFQQFGIAFQGWVAKLTNKTVGVGAGISASGGPIVGVNATLARQLVVSPNGQAAYVNTFNNALQLPFNAVVLPPDVGAYGGLQVSVSNAKTPQDLAGASVDYGYGGGRGWGGGGDVSIGTGTNGQVVWSVSGTAGGGLGGVGHGLTTTLTTVTPICRQ